MLFSLFLNYRLILFSNITARIFNPTAERTMPIGIATNKAKPEAETQPVLCSVIR